MTPDNLALVKATRKHWCKVKEKVDFANRVSCPLCQEYNNDELDDDESCEGCPIYARTGYKFCRETPFEELCHHHSREEHLGRVGNKCSECEQIIDEEIIFLEELERELNEDS